jgi:glycine cleavage system aminomethyltransferase T
MDNTVPHTCCELWKDEQIIGTVTTGIISHLQKYDPGMVYVFPKCTNNWMVLEVKILKCFDKASVVSMPFYDPDTCGMRWKNV